ncbi:hypothetical protein [Devosia sp. 66-22]|uniref:hypothetical protein n=1 Tax=Devosia sp. 66-22 TaxID=1895753 RepID=UPI00263A2431|nr:hypothetical protein [Devosia sp. 66-22]
MALLTSLGGARLVAALGGAGGIVLGVATLACTPGISRGEIALVDGVFLVVATIIVFQSVRVGHKLLGGSDPQSLPAPPPLMLATAVWLVTVPLSYPLTLPVDDYHFGESLLAYQALLEGPNWFTDFLSPHGYSDALGGVLAKLLGDDSGPGIYAGDIFLLHALAFIVSWRILRRLGAVGGIFLALVLPQNSNILFVLLILIAVAEAATSSRPWAAGALASLLSAAGVLLYAGPAVAAVLSAFVGGLLFHTLSGRRSIIAYLGGAALSSIALLAIAWPMIRGQFHFLSVSAAANLTIYGNSSLDIFAQHPQNLMFAASPMLAALAISWKELRSRTTVHAFLALGVVVVPMVTLAMLLNSYAMARLDDAGARAVMAGCVCLIFLPFLVRLVAPTRRDAITAGLCASLLMLVAPPSSAILSEQPLVFPPKWESGAVIDASVPRLGSGRFEADHVERIKAVKRTVDTLLEPGETFLNLTNRNALYYYLDRPIPVPVSSTYNAAPEALQKAFISAISDSIPPLALIEVDNIEHDGFSLPLRAHSIYDFSVANYVPFLREGHTYGIRRDLVARLERLPTETASAYSLSQVTDQYWVDGVAAGDNAARWSFVVDGLTALALKVGDTLRFSDGIDRVIVEIEDRKIRTAPSLPVDAAPNGDRLSFTITNRTPAPLSEEDLWAAAFHQGYLARLPSAWGRSSATLQGELAGPSVRFHTPSLSEAVLIKGSRTTYRLTAGRSELDYRPSSLIDPQRQGILSFSAACRTQGVLPVLQVYWRGTGGEFSEPASVTFEASAASNLVPLDTSPHWTFNSDVAELRVAVLNANECSRITLTRPTILERRTVD